MLAMSAWAPWTGQSCGSGGGAWLDYLVAAGQCGIGNGPAFLQFTISISIITVLLVFIIGTSYMLS